MAVVTAHSLYAAAMSDKTDFMHICNIVNSLSVSVQPNIKFTIFIIKRVSNVCNAYYCLER